MQIRPLVAGTIGITAFIVAPLTFYAVSDAPFRSVLKDVLSVLTLLAFVMMLAQFYLARSNTLLLEIFKPPLIQKVHKYIAYSAITLIVLHPFLIVVPRYFEGGIDPWTAFVEILSNFTNIGVLTGIIAWLVLVAVGLTAYFRKPVIKRMATRYRGWRGLHGVLVLAFILPATWHVIDLGRHISLGLTIYVLVVLLGGLALLGRLYPDHFPMKLFAKAEVPAQ